MYGETAESATAWGPPARPRRVRGRIVFWVLFGLSLAAVVAGVTLGVSSVHPYVQSGTNMEPTIMPGDHLLVARGPDVRRGDVIVFTRPGVSAPLFARVIGLPGDHVQCCDAQHRIQVDGKPLVESYINPGQPPSERSFSAALGPGRMWVMGDNRIISLDSRSYGPIPTSGIIGRVVSGSRGASGAFHTPQTFVTDGLAPPDRRLVSYLGPGVLAAAGLVAVIGLAIFGTARFFLRRRRSATA